MKRAQSQTPATSEHGRLCYHLQMKPNLLIYTAIALLGTMIVFTTVFHRMYQTPSVQRQPDTLFITSSTARINSQPENDASSVTETIASSGTTSTPAQAIPNPDSIALSPPLENALGRITKKPFGIYITKKNSPVQPERFSGYHTGTDFETTPEEQTVDVEVRAVCTGKLVLKKKASGYGGVAVQDCTIHGQAVTVVYGHVRLSSIAMQTGETVRAGMPFAVLGTGFSAETDGERKHLHLGIHKGTAISILGYVQSKSSLSQWMDAEKLLQ